MRKSLLMLIAIVICGISYAQASHNKRYEDLEAYAKAFGIIRYYSPNPYAMEWNELDWSYIAYADVKSMENGESVQSVIGNLISVMAPNATLTSEPKPSSRKIHGNNSEYSYLLHRGSGELNIPKAARIFSKELKEYRPFSIELIPCSNDRLKPAGHNSPLPLEPSELPRPDSIYCYQLTPDLYLNIPHAEREDAFSRKAVSKLHKNAENRWNDSLKSYGKKPGERALGFFGERAFKLGNAIMRWNIIQHFYPYHEEDGLNWEDNLSPMMAAVDTLPEGRMDKAGLYEWYNAVRRSVSQVRDSHFMTYRSFSTGGFFDFFLPLFYVPEVFDYEDGKIMLNGSEVLTINGKDAASAWHDAMKLISSSSEAERRESALGLLAETPEHNTPFVLELRDMKTDEVRKDTLYATSENPGHRMPDNRQFAQIIDDVLIINPTLGMECYEQFVPYLDKIDQYRAVIFDLRGYPAYDFDKVLEHLIDEPIATEFFYTPRSTFPNRNHLYYESAPETISPASKHIDIPVYFLANHRTMSWGETVMMLVKGYGLGTIIGTNTCGTNGDATQLNVPAFMFGMTALKAVNRDGSRHHGIGVVPDVYMEDIDIEKLSEMIDSF